MISDSAIHMIMPKNHVEPKGHEGAHIRVMLGIYSIFNFADLCNFTVITRRKS